MRHTHVFGLPLAAALLLVAVSFSLWNVSSPRPYLAQVGAVGLVVGVAPNEVNTLAAELKLREDELLAKETDLRRREEMLRAREEEKEETLQLYVGAGGSLLFVLLLLNFYFDYRTRGGVRIPIALAGRT